jgi:hypothetical protein
MNFGLLDLTNKENKYDFHINVENADLNQLNLVKDSVSILREMLLCRFQEIPLKIYKETFTLKKPLIKIIKTPIILMILTLGLVLMKTGFAPLNSPDIIEEKS